MVSKRRRLMALLLAVMMLVGVMTVGTLSTSAASGDTVYCENAAGWGTVYCYMWGDSDKNAEWPGVAMTKGDGNLWSYTMTGDWNNIIFNAGMNQAQTGDMTYPASGNCYNNSTNSWSNVSLELRYVEEKTNEETAMVLEMTMDNYYNKHKLAKAQFCNILRKEGLL